MYVNTTGTQVTRAVALWVTGLGCAFFVLVGGQLFVWDDPGMLIFDLAMIGGGGITWFGAVKRLQALDAHNRPFLRSAGGASIMAPRHAFERRVRRVRNILLVVFLAMCVGMLWVLSTSSCEQVPDGICASMPELDRWVLDVTRLATLAVGAAYVAAAILVVTHAKETERLDAVIAAGQFDRREGPIPGTSRSRWE